MGASRTGGFLLGSVPMKSFLGHCFHDENLLSEALTTPSCRMDRPNVVDNQRLEFLGDAILGALAAERLYGEFPGDPEGSLTVKRTHMVSTAALCAAANRLGLSAHLLRNRGAEPLPKDAKTLADAMEAFEPLTEGCDLAGDRGPLRLVIGQGDRVSFMADPVAELRTLNG